MHLARRSLMTIAVGTFCVSCVLLPAVAQLATTTAPVGPVVVALDPASAEWPRTLARLWFLIPHLLPRDN